MSSYWDRQTDNAVNSYLGHCLDCGKFEAVGGVSSLCFACRLKKMKKRRKK